MVTSTRPADIFHRPAQGKDVLCNLFIVLREWKVVLRNLMASCGVFYPSCGTGRAKTSAGRVKLKQKRKYTKNEYQLFCKKIGKIRF